MMYRFNLLQPIYDMQCDWLINGYIDYKTFEYLEIKFKNQSELFTICLN